uniref:ATP synthase F0 subunit a n=1 Tax=Spizellomyces sp. 'palustris' TaxID=117820 RepID=UPI0010FC2B46|nr:ATP synthase F0 subunit a [Spizellomyces sp. 'palustris']QCQ69025.1 ATP synthase F0 subunit a [Spizellomyces sp. 'palustris']
MTNNYLLYSSPMEQYEIYPLVSFSLTLNNVIFYLLIAGLISTLITYVGTTRGELVSNWWGILSESLYRTILSMVENYIGIKFTVYLPLIYTVFHLILFSNLIGMVPYSSTPTVEIIMTLSIALTLLVAVLLIGFLSHKLLLLAAFIPAGTPLGLVPLMIVLEILAYVTRTLSLGLRLAVNMITGHILAKVCVGFIWVAYLKGTSLLVLTLPLLLLTLFLGLELLIAYLQAYIFTFITCITIKDMAIFFFMNKKLLPMNNLYWSLSK